MAAPLDLDVLAALVAIALVVAVVADMVVAELAAVVAEHVRLDLDALAGRGGGGRRARPRRALPAAVSGSGGVRASRRST
ncbi:MAG: hypothetical protein E6J90_03740 [Deltaproteobacteria bacterium]|nr:MAG: hypothetical protein E6J91_48690 [Deltaproteobacteria bacterium]TMQ26828.1 MAG: hypothetical protein E6J90_03740 [Deltaproteobacteria bacterium]